MSTDRNRPRRTRLGGLAPGVGADAALQALAEVIRVGGDLPALVGGLLRVASEHEEALREGERSDALFAAVLPLAGVAARAVRGAPASLDGAREAVCAALDALAALGGPGAAFGARRLALEIDASPAGELLTDHLLARGERVLSGGDLVPFLSPLGRPEHPLRRAYEGRLGTSPARLGLDAATLPRAGRLAPRLPFGARLRLAPGYGAALDGLSGDARVGCAAPSTRAALADPPIEDGPRGPRFFGVAPRDPAEQRRRALALFARADAEGASIVVLPEVSLDEAGAKALAAWATTEASRLSLAVCGSFHAKRGRERRNVCLVAARGAPPREIAKLVPFVVRVGGADATEDVRPAEPEVVLLAGTRASALVLVCRDFVDRELSRAAEDLRPTLVLVPAASPRTSDFAANAARLASAAQAHVVIANLCDDTPDERPAVALLARPDRLERQPIELARADVDPPVLALASLGAGGWTVVGEGGRPPTPAT